MFFSYVAGIKAGAERLLLVVMVLSVFEHEQSTISVNVIKTIADFLNVFILLTPIA
jgi:uncharacterized membrane protein (DUF373 family)